MKIEVRSTNKGNTIRGYAARYGVLSRQLEGGVFERLVRGAFSNVLRSNPDVVCLYNHDVNRVLGRTSNKTLRLNEDANGLSFECDLPNTSYADDLVENIRSGNLNGASFAFTADQGEDYDLNEEDVDDEGKRGLVRRFVRTVRNIRKVFDVSVVTNPAYPGTSVALRSLGVERHFERSAAIVRYRTPSVLPQALAELRSFNKEHGSSFSLGEMHDAKHSQRARQRMLQEILD